MNATPVNQTQRELVRILYLEHGHRRASEISGVPYDKVRKWVSRYGWKRLSQSVTNPAQAIAETISNELADNERETRLSLSRYARRVAKDAESATLKDAPYVKAAAQTAGIVHRWDSTDKPNHFTLNMLNLNSLRIESDGTITDQP